MLAKILPFLTGRQLYSRAVVRDLLEDAQRNNALWPDMYLCQPPVNSLLLVHSEVEEDPDDAPPSVHAWIKWFVYTWEDGGGGITIGELLKWLSRYRFMASVEGVDMWEEWSNGGLDLGRVVKY